MYKVDWVKGGNYVIDNDFIEICLNLNFQLEIWFKVIVNFLLISIYC